LSALVGASFDHLLMIWALSIVILSGGSSSTLSAYIYIEKILLKYKI